MKFKHGDYVTCEIEGKQIDDARISINKERHYFVCQNKKDGATTRERFGYKYSWRFDPQYPDVDGVSALKLKNRTIKDLRQGDIIACGGIEREVLGVCGRVLFVSAVGNFDEASSCYYTIEELVDMGFRLKSEPEEALEVTMADLEEKYGKKVKVIK